ncbi:MAG TPA: hypothetical protein VGP19_00465 [Candidatus Acidoferrales bacterium]|nr:hypothetical protein [Candidatus Acidoferrales bacterium]
MSESHSHPEAEAQKRRTTRIVQAVPLTVTGVDALGRPFQERTSTLIINCHGARYQSKHYVLKNMWVTLEVPHNEAGREARSVRARVTWIQRPRTVRELFQIGVELEVSGNVWGIAFPPGDWFPFPEPGGGPQLEIPAPSEAPQQVAEAEDWSTAEVAPAMQAPGPEPVEDNLRVLPLPASGDASLQIARQVARLVAEAKQQIQNTARESATHAVAAETGPLLATLQIQLRDAAEKSVAAAVAAHIENSQQVILQRLEKEQETGVAAVLARLSSELDLRLSHARLQIDTQLAEVERTRRAEFEQKIQNQLQGAIQKLESLRGSVGANQDEAQATLDQLRESSAKAAAEEIRRWQEQMDLRTADAQARLAQMDQAARKLGEQIAAATAIGEVGWRGVLETDLAAAIGRWQEKMEASLEEAARRASEQLAKTGEASARQIEQQLQQRISSLGNAHSQATAEAETALGTLRAAISQEAAKGEFLVSQFQQSVAQLEAQRDQFSDVLKTAADDWARRSAAMIETQTSEMNQRAESAVAGMAQRMQPMLEAAGLDTIERLASELEQRLLPELARASEMVGKLGFDREQVEKAVAEHQQRIWQVSERGLQDTAARGKQVLAQIEKDFAESARAASGRWLGELETRATETSHATFEALFKSADWYEKKIQTQMQTTLEKGLDQAASRLREKAAEMSGLFASELDHYSRSYVEHARDQMQENAREAGERGSQQISEAGDAAAAKFTERAAQLGHEQFDLHASKTKTALEQNTAAMEAHTTQIRSKLEGDVRNFAAEFQRALSQHAQQTLALGKQELGIQVDQAKDALLIESQALERQFHESLTSQGALAMDEHKQRLENASNSWLLTTVTKLNQQSESLISELADTTDKKLKAVCGNVFSEMGETLRQRLAGLAAPFAAPAAPNVAVPAVNRPDDHKK